MSEATAADLIKNRAIWPDDFREAIPRIREVADFDLAVPADLTERLAANAGDLLVPEEFLTECAAALMAGHLVLQGPPGTGKSSLARALARSFNAGLLPVTAHEDWSTFEVVGRQELRVDENNNEEIVPVDGHFTEAVIRCAGRIPSHFDNPDNPQAEWLLIDELNRAHPDKAFGELFSALGSDDPVDITLGYQRAGNNTLAVPRRFRIIATINSVDKQFVNALSQGLRRRFTFLTLDIPNQRGSGQQWGTDSSIATEEYLVACAAAIRRAARKTGLPASDFSEHLAHADCTQRIHTLFDVVERVRYASYDSDDPYIPIGTAPLIDTIELYLIGAGQKGFDLGSDAATLDWATSVKLVPLFDAGGANREKLNRLASSLPAPFDRVTRRGILEIESDGMFSVR